MGVFEYKWHSAKRPGVTVGEQVLQKAKVIIGRPSHILSSQLSIIPPGSCCNAPLSRTEQKTEVFYPFCCLVFTAGCSQLDVVLMKSLVLVLFWGLDFDLMFIELVYGWSNWKIDWNNPGCCRTFLERGRGGNRSCYMWLHVIVTELVKMNRCDETLVFI